MKATSQKYLVYYRYGDNPSFSIVLGNTTERFFTVTKESPIVGFCGMARVKLDYWGLFDDFKTASKYYQQQVNARRKHLRREQSDLMDDQDKVKRLKEKVSKGNLGKS